MNLYGKCMEMSVFAMKIFCQQKSMHLQIMIFYIMTKCSSNRNSFFSKPFISGRGNVLADAVTELFFPIDLTYTYQPMARTILSANGQFCRTKRNSHHICTFKVRFAVFPHVKA